jgi:hypothetical protein
VQPGDDLLAAVALALAAATWAVALAAVALAALALAAAATWTVALLAAVALALALGLKISDDHASTETNDMAHRTRGAAWKAAAVWEAHAAGAATVFFG